MVQERLVMESHGTMRHPGGCVCYNGENRSRPISSPSNSAVRVLPAVGGLDAD
jgi:hypothetical protein